MVYMSGKVWYLAGPMTWIAQFNYPKFDRIAAELRAQGLEIRSPAELDDPETRKAALASPDGTPGSGAMNDETWGDFLKRDVKLIADEVDGVIVMDGWHKSRGARLETFVAAMMCGKPVLYYPSLQRVRKLSLIKAWIAPWWDLIEP